MPVVKDPFRNPTAVLANRRTSIIVGAAAGNLTVPGITLQDRLLRVISFTIPAAATDLTSQFSITAANTINNTGGTTTASLLVYVEWEDHDMGSRTNAAWNV